MGIEDDPICQLAVDSVQEVLKYTAEQKQSVFSTGSLYPDISNITLNDAKMLRWGDK